MLIVEEVCYNTICKCLKRIIVHFFITTIEPTSLFGGYFIFKETKHFSLFTSCSFLNIISL
nr:MAG TPA: hypothetical protein [Caudoviricetes sp.]